MDFRFTLSVPSLSLPPSALKCLVEKRKANKPKREPFKPTGDKIQKLRGLTILYQITLAEALRNKDASAANRVINQIVRS